MAFNPFDVTTPHIFYASLGGFVVLFGMFSLFLREKLYIGEACWAFLFGVIIGPYGANIFNPRDWGGGTEQTTDMVTLELTRVVLAIGVFAIGVELPKAYMARHWRSLAMLLIPVMTWGWFVSAALIFALVPGLTFLSSLAVAACLTPTDPILAAAVIGGKYADKHVPIHIRHLIASESGCNDGAAFPFLYIALYLIVDRDTGDAVKDWFLLLWLYQVVLGVVIGSLIGFAFRYLMKFCERNNLIDRQSYVAQYISLAVLTIGVTTLIGSDDLLSAFACGTAFAWDGFFNKQTEESVFSSVIDLLFNVAAFVYIGAWTPFNDFNDAALTLNPWRLVVIAILILLLRRLPVMIALYRWIPDIKTLREAVFCGHFGPIGVGGIFISTLAAGRLPIPSNPPANQTEFLAATIQPIVAFMVLCSITVHGLSIPSFSLGRRIRTVSRTWSRPAPPEWTNQATRVDRPEDIVINRDSVMERGELSLDEKLAEVEGGRVRGDSARDGGRPIPVVDAAALSDVGISDDVKLDEEERMKEENVPDGDEKEMEWREGVDKVVERRAGPGEEVEVEVIENAFTSPREAEQMSSTFRATGDSVNRTLGGAHTDKMPQKGVERTEDVIQDEPGEAERDEEEEEEEEEDGWTSDPSDNEPSAASPNRRGRSNSPKSRTSPKAVGAPPRRGRRRSSLRKGTPGRTHLPLKLQPHPEISSLSEGADGQGGGGGHRERGRSEVVVSEVNSDEPPFRKNRWLDTIRHMDARREASPARSIRFADEIGDEENRSGAATPQLSILQDSGPPPLPLTSGDVDSPQSKVTFEVGNN